MASVGSVNIINMCGLPATIDVYQINKTAVTAPSPSAPIAQGGTYVATYGAKGCKDFTDFLLQVTVTGNSSVTYKIDLPKSNFFEGKTIYHYPGNDTNVQFFLMGFTDDMTHLRLCSTYLLVSGSEFIIGTQFKDMLQASA